MNVKTPIAAFLFYLSIGFGLLAAQPSLFFHIDNERVVTHPTLGNAFAVDVSMYASYAGTYHSRGLLYLKYDTTRFGTFVDNRNNIAFEHDTLLRGIVNFFGQLRPKYLTVNVIDNLANVVAFTWESEWLNFLPQPGLHNEVPDTLAKLYTVYFKIVNPPSAGDVEIHLSLMPNQQFFITDTDGDGNPDEVPYGAVGLLPIELMDFQASWLDEERVALSWATFTETNNRYFVIEKRHENGRFFRVGEVKGAGNSDEIQTYHWIDQTAQSNSTYYRLRQVDMDGRSNFSNIIQLEAKKTSLAQLYPSPTNSLLYISASSGSAYAIVISDITGKIHLKHCFQFTTSQTIQTIDLSGLAEGVYFAQIMDEQGQSRSQKIIKSQP